MSAERKIANAVQKLAGNQNPVSLIQGEVVSYDEAKETCVVLIANDVQLPNVGLTAAISDGLLILPTVGSNIWVLRSVNGTNPVAIQFSDIDKVIMRAGDAVVTLWNSTQTGGYYGQLNDGSYGGIPIISDPNNPQAGLLARINQLEKNLTNLAAYVGGLPIPIAGSVSGPAIPANTQAFQITVLTQKSDIENRTFTHGK